MEATFRAGGLASGLDSNSIIDSLADIQRNTIRQMEKRQEAFKIQLSGIGNLKNKIEALHTATSKLSENGVLASSITSGAAGFTAVAEDGAVAGTYDVMVTNLARAAKARTAVGFTDSGAPVTGGNLSINVGGTITDVPIADGDALSDVAFKINQSGANVTASIVSDGVNSYLSVTTNETGHEIGQPPGSALSITETSTGSLGQPLGLSVIQQAENATFEVDGLAIERRSNTVTDVVSKTTLTLNQVTAAPEELKIQRDLEGTKEALQTFLDAYNALNELIQGDLDVDENTDRQKTLAGDPSLRSLQTRLKQIMTVEVAAAGTDIRTLVDIGIKSEKDGSLTLDEGTLKEALARDESAVRAVFAATGGIAEQVENLRDVQNDADDGVLSARQEGLNARLEQLDLDIANQELRIEKFRETLIAKFTAMEEIVSRMNSMSDFISQLKFPGFSSGDK